jgi:hypothetical protein
MSRLERAYQAIKASWSRTRNHKLARQYRQPEARLPTGYTWQRFEARGFQSVSDTEGEQVSHSLFRVWQGLSNKEKVCLIVAAIYALVILFIFASMWGLP